MMVSGQHILMYSGGEEGSKGTGFLISKSIKQSVIDFNAINDRMCSLRLRAKFFNITVFCVYAPTEEAEDEEKDVFYTKLEEEINKVQRHDVKMILGDLNAKIGREEVYRHVIGKESLHKDSNDNGLRLIDFASGKQMIIKSTWHPRKNINKETWISPDGVTRNQIDHVIIDRRHASDIMDVRSCRGADADSDHYLVRIRYRQKNRLSKNGKKQTEQQSTILRASKMRN